MSKYFCINCFEDENIKDFIKKDGVPVKDKKFKCDFCQKTDPLHCEKYDIKDYNRKLFKSDEIYTISQDFFNKKIIEIINRHFYHIESPKFNETYELLDLVDILSNKLFMGETTDILIKLAKYNFIKCKNFPFKESEQREYTDNSEQNYLSQENHLIRCWRQKENISWKNFSKHTKHKARYFDHEKSDFKISQALEPFKKVYKSLQIDFESKKVYRARIISKDKLNLEIKKIKKNKKINQLEIIKDLLGKAPNNIVKNNRFSPIGISYGYFSFDEKTAICEVRAEPNEETVIGIFELKEKLSLIDFSKRYGLSSVLYAKEDMNPFDENFNILLVDVYEFISDISKPINENDTLLEYVPTQIMAEYIWSIGYDGFIFDSSQNKDGENIVLFGENPEYINHKFIKIKSKDIQYNYEEA